MANAAPASIGRVNASGSEDALFLKVFAGEVITSFNRASVTEGSEMVRSKMILKRNQHEFDLPYIRLDGGHVGDCLSLSLIHI